MGTKTGGVYTTLQFRLHPAPDQTLLLEKTFGCCRWLWNHMLADAQEFYAATGLQHIPTPACYKGEAPFLREVDSQPLCTVHQQLRRAYLDFFRNPEAFGPPRFKTKKARKDSFTVYCRQYRTGPSIRLTDRGLQMPKLGLVPARVYRKPKPGWNLRLVTIRKTRSGKYFCAISYDMGLPAPAPRPLPGPEETLGLHFSPARFYTDSKGQSPALPPLGTEKLRRLQSRLARLEPGSRNYREQLQKIRLQQEHIANQRKDFAHQESRRIANAWEAVCLRETDLAALSERWGGGRVKERAFGRFRDCLRYKLERQGKRYVTVEPYAPAARTCQCCGAENKDLAPGKKLWRCPACGAELDRDANTARNLRDMGLAQCRKAG